MRFQGLGKISSVLFACLFVFKYSTGHIAKQGGVAG